MKLINIALAAVTLLFAASCSTEDDLMNEMAKQQQQAVTEGNAYLSFSVNAQAAQTKAGSSDESGEPTGKDVVEDCSIILFNEDNTVYAAYDQLTVSNGEIPFKVQVKLNESGKKFKVMAIANTEQEYAGAADYDEVIAKVLGENDMNKSVKASELKEVTLTGYATLAEAMTKAQTIELTLQQLTARIELSTFTVNFHSNTDPVDVQIKDIKLVNQNIAGLPIKGDETKKDLVIDAWSSASPMYIYTAAIEETPGENTFNNLTEGKPFFNTFPNAKDIAEDEANATAIQFTLVYESADGKNEKTFQFAINRKDGDGFTNNAEHDYIQAGYIYRLEIEANLTSAIDCSVKCYTLDWNYNKLTYTF